MHSPSLDESTRPSTASSGSAGPSGELKLPYFASTSGVPKSLMKPGLGLRSESMGFRSVFPGAPRIERRTFPTETVYRSLSGIVGSEGGLVGVSPQFSRLSVNDGPEVRPRPLPVFYEKSTSFTCDRSASEIFRALEAALVDYDTAPKPSKGKVKVEAEMMGGTIRFQVHIFQMPKGSAHLIEFQRRSGCSCGFWHIFRDVMESLSADLADAAAFVKSHQASRPTLNELRNLWEKHTEKVRSCTTKSLVTELSRRLTASMLAEQN
mmetsp:Transcript_9624/g.23690  ORF Transcript_9624/g.23690 Transcript_9624/m.23690 type:complete len:265 (+) Transcript_9624:57-851(+)